MPDPIAEYHRLLEAERAAGEQAAALREAFARERVTFDAQPSGEDLVLAITGGADAQAFLRAQVGYTSRAAASSGR